MEEGNVRWRGPSAGRQAAGQATGKPRPPHAVCNARCHVPPPPGPLRCGKEGDRSVKELRPHTPNTKQVHNQTERSEWSRQAPEANAAPSVHPTPAAAVLGVWPDQRHTSWESVAPLPTTHSELSPHQTYLLGWLVISKIYICTYCM